MPNLKFAAIDIGSNAVRLLVSNVFEAPEGAVIRKLSLNRVPVRLGEDAFLHGKISDERVDAFLHTLHAFKHLMQVHKVETYRACATSAMRDAQNGSAIVQRVAKETGIDIEIIDGKEEASIIYGTQLQDYIKLNHSYLYVDVGGGSTEITLFVGKRIQASRSFNIGTLRILNNQVEADHWKDLKHWLRKATKEQPSVHIIGSGGNINKTFKMLRKPMGKPVSFAELKSFHAYLDSYTVDERVRYLELRPDRADVIVPAAQIFLTVMKNANSKKLFVPKFGLADGIVKQLYDEFHSAELAKPKK